MNTEQQVQPGEETEDVADVLQQILPYWKPIAGAALLVFAGVAGFGFLSSSRNSALEAEWGAYLTATANRDSTGLQQLADATSGEVSVWARQSAAQSKLIEASSQVYTDRTAAKSKFQEAADGFENVLSMESLDTLIEQRARWGAAQSYEGLQELGKAKDHYDNLVTGWPGSEIAEKAQARIDSLNDESTQEFIQWFYAQSPPSAPASSPGGIPNLPFEVPTDPISIPDPTIDTSKLPSTSSDAGDASTDALDITVEDESDDGSSETSTNESGANN